MDVIDVSTEPKAEIQQWNCSGGDNQVFIALEFKDGYQLKAAPSNHCLDIRDTVQRNGGLLQQYFCHPDATGNLNQTFYLQEVGQPSENSTTIWKGFVTQQSPEATYNMTVEFPNDLAVGTNSTVVDYSEYSCGGYWTLNNIAGATYAFTETIPYGQDVCTQGGSITMTEGNETLFFEYKSGSLTASSTLSQATESTQ